jgi:predicted acetyltransferase
MSVTLQEVSNEASPLLRRLMQFYLYDLGTIDGWNISTDGLFGNAEKIERFWTEPGRRSFLINVDAEIAGFALIRDQAAHAGTGVHEVSEFFVLRKFRRQRVGERAATMLFDMMSGPWEVAQLASNLPAQQFWRAVLARYTDGHFTDIEASHENSGWTWRGRVQHFTAPGARTRS